MANLAAVLPALKAPLEIREVETYTPGPHELLVKNEIIPLNPVKFKIAKLGLFPVHSPIIIGISFGGVVEAVGPQVTNFKVGDKIVSATQKYVMGVDSQYASRYGSYQRYVVAEENTASKVPEGIDIAIPATLIPNLSSVVALFNVRAGLDRPNFDGPVSIKDKKILIYGGSSNFGTLSVQYVSRAGYTVITTSSPKNKDFVSRLGAIKVIDHSQEQDALLKALLAEGPYDLVVDSVALPNTTTVTGAVVAAQGGGKLYTLQPAFGPETLPEGVTREF